MVDEHCSLHCSSTAPELFVFARSPLFVILYRRAVSNPNLIATAARRQLSPAYTGGGVITFKDVHPPLRTKVFIIAVPIVGPDFAPNGPSWCCTVKDLSQLLHLSFGRGIPFFP